MGKLSIKNTTPGPKGVNTVEGLVFLEAGQSRDDLEVAKAEFVSAAATGWFEMDGDPLDHDGDGRKGGSRSDAPPALTGKNKAELLAIAADEGVTIEDGATNPDIVSAIELAREEKAKG